MHSIKGSSAFLLLVAFGQALTDVQARAPGVRLQTLWRARKLSVGGQRQEPVPPEPTEQDIAFMQDPWFRANFAITYDNKGMKDGSGAQAVRMLGIYTIARAYGLNYVHNPVTAVAHTQLVDSWTQRWQTFLQLPSDAVNITKFRQVCSQPWGALSFESLQQAMLLAKKQNTSTLFHILYPYSLGNFSFQQPKMVAALSELRGQVHPPRQEPSMLRTVRVAVHVRRGDITGSSRHMPASYYVGAASAIAQELQKLGKSYTVELFTELGHGCANSGSKPHQLVYVTEAARNQSRKGGKTHTAEYLVDAGCPRFLGQQHLKQENEYLKELHKIPNIILLADMDPIWSMQQIRTADVIVVSKSAYSMVPAMLASPSTIVLRPIEMGVRCNSAQWLPSWFVALNEDTGDLPGNMVAAIRQQYGNSSNQTAGGSIKQQT